MTSEPDPSPSQSDPIPGSVYQQSDMGVAWNRGATVRGQEFGPGTALMLDLAGLEPGERVLDIGAGTGETAMLAAERVGETAAR